MINLAVIGTSMITGELLKSVNKCEGIHLKAVYSRDLERAKQFGNQYGANQFFDSLDDLAKSTDIDAVYIASPNNLHCEQAIQMMKNKKHILCEKPMASNLNEVEQMVQTAKENNVVLLEAMRLAFDPGFHAIKENLHKLGTIRRATFQYCKYSSRYDLYKQGNITNIFNPAYSAGALMDLGVYCIYPTVALFGMPDSIEAAGILLDNGIDGTGSILVKYPHMVGELSYSKITEAESQNQIQGEVAVMQISEIHGPDKVEIIYRDGRKEMVYNSKVERQIDYEVNAFVEFIDKGIKPDQFTQYSIMTMKLLDEARRKMGVVFPADN